MTRRFRYPGFTLLILTLLLAAQPAAANSIRIMPVGDSDTEGYGGFVSYRYDLWFMLLEAGYNVDFVGRNSLTGGGVDTDLYTNYEQLDKDHEGRYGSLIEGLADAAASMTRANQPDIVLFLNSHDICDSGSGATTTARIHLDRFISNVRAVNPNAHFLLGQIYPYQVTSCNQDSLEIIPAYNQEIANVAANTNSAQSRVLAVDHYTGFDMDTMFSAREFHANRAGEQFMAENWFDSLQQVLPLVEPPGATFTINAGLNDAWYDPATDGQGFLIVVYEDIQLVFLAWFTYDTERPPGDVVANLGEPGHRWFTAQGPFDGNRAVLDVIVSEGGIFDSGVPLPENRVDGKIELVFEDCKSATVNYEIESAGLSGTIPIQRVADGNVPLCEVLAEGASQ